MVTKDFLCFTAGKSRGRVARVQKWLEYCLERKSPGYFSSVHNLYSEGD